MDKEIEKRIASADDADKDWEKAEENSLQPIEYDLPTLKNMIQSDEEALEQMRILDPRSAIHICQVFYAHPGA
jgi:hypothetical protein